MEMLTASSAAEEIQPFAALIAVPNSAASNAISGRVAAEAATVHGKHVADHPRRKGR